MIKTLYEVLEKGALRTYDSVALYSAQFLSQKEINDLTNFQNNRIRDLHISIFFSKTFISFSKDKEIAEKFLLIIIIKILY